MANKKRLAAASPILRELRSTLGDQGMTLSDIIAFSTGPVRAQENGEIVIRLHALNVNVCFRERQFPKRTASSTKVVTAVGAMS